MASLPNVCVIGAGVSGLTACKALDDFDVPHTCFEASDEVGGNWYFQNPNGVSSAYRSLHIDISKPSISFRDFPMPDRYPDYPHHSHIHEWLCDYADAFDVRRNIRFNTRVSSAERGAGGGWTISLDDGSPHGGGQASQSFDALLVCNGHHWDPRRPDFPGSFDGPQIHSHDYIDPSDPLDLKGKRVLVVGIGNSAVDIVSELGRKTMCEVVFLSTRSGAYVVPKYLFGKPADQVVKSNPMLPAKLQRRMARLLPLIFSGRMEDFGLPTPNHQFLDAHPTVSSELLGRLGAGDAVAKGDVAELLGDAVRFADGSVEQVDAIIYATGYNVSFPFFQDGFMSAPDNVLPLYKRMLKPGIDDLAFIGLGQPIPTIFPFSELQSKIAARWLSGDWAPPPPAQMEREIVEDEAFHTGHFLAKPRHTMQLEWYSYKRELEKRTIPQGQQRAREGAPTGAQAAGRAGAGAGAGPAAAGAGPVPAAGGAGLSGAAVHR
ncbi:MAG: flavin-containing monooxygenase [Solirubrobacteraceae bacterium]